MNLQEALDRYDTTRGSFEPNGYITLFVTAARSVAEGTKIRWCLEHGYIRDRDIWLHDSMDNPCVIVKRLLVEPINL